MKNDPASSDITPRQSRSNVVPLKGEIDLHVSPTRHGNAQRCDRQETPAVGGRSFRGKLHRQRGARGLDSSDAKGGRLRRQIHAGRIAGNRALDLRNFAARSGLSNFPGRGRRAGWLAIRVTRNDGFPAVNAKSTAAQAVVPWRMRALPGYACQNLKRLRDIVRNIELRCAFDVNRTGCVASRLI